MQFSCHHQEKKLGLYHAQHLYKRPPKLRPQQNECQHRHQNEQSNFVQRVALHKLIQPEFYKSKILSEAEAIFGAKLFVGGGVKYGLFSIKLKSVQILQEVAADMAEIGSISVNFNPLSLLIFKPKVQSVVFSDGSIDLHQILVYKMDKS